jgi:hypothetical protein
MNMQHWPAEPDRQFLAASGLSDRDLRQNEESGQLTPTQQRILQLQRRQKWRDLLVGIGFLAVAAVPVVLGLILGEYIVLNYLILALVLLVLGAGLLAYLTYRGHRRLSQDIEERRVAKIEGEAILQPDDGFFFTRIYLLRFPTRQFRISREQYLALGAEDHTPVAGLFRVYFGPRSGVLVNVVRLEATDSAEAATSQ